jgi:hypothetical protein
MKRAAGNNPPPTLEIAATARSSARNATVNVNQKL